MSLAVNLLFRLTEQVAGLLDDDYDIEIVEMHHRHKIDAPSGTALGLGRAAARARGVAFDEVAARGRDGVTGARPRGEIGFAALRGGDVIGEHSVIFAADGERLELAVRSSNRQTYARGAVQAARWAAGRGPWPLHDGGRPRPRLRARDLAQPVRPAWLRSRRAGSRGCG